MAKKVVKPEATDSNSTATTVAKEIKVKRSKLADIKSVKLTKEQFEKLGSAELLSLTVNQGISIERAKKFLVDRVREGRINGCAPQTIMNWTYKSVQVAGVNDKIRGAKKAKVTLTADEFAKLTPDQKANYVDAYTFKKRAASIVAALIGKGMPVSAEDLVYLTNGRVEVEGIAVPRQNRAPVVVDGVEFS